MWRVHWYWRNTKKTTQTSSLKYFQIVVETSPITCNGIFHDESVLNTLFFNNYKIKLITCDRLHWCCRNTKKRPKHLVWNISKSWWRPFLSHVMVFFMLNHCRILCFTIIIRENSLHLTLVLKKYLKTSQTSSMKYFQIVVETFPIICNGIFHVE
jgi:hypothetical protein